MILHENRLPADDSHEISCLIGYISKKRPNLKLSSAANYRWRFTLTLSAFRNSIRASNRLDPHQNLIWVQTVCKGYQQMAKIINHLINNIIVLPVPFFSEKAENVGFNISNAKCLTEPVHEISKNVAF